MFIREFKKETNHVVKVKPARNTPICVIVRMCVLRCDNCDAEFERARGSMDPKRLNNNYFHVCKNCDSKKFAQKMGVTKKQIWDMPASSNLDISKL